MAKRYIVRSKLGERKVATISEATELQERIGREHGWAEIEAIKGGKSMAKRSRRPVSQQSAAERGQFVKRMQGLAVWAKRNGKPGALKRATATLRTLRGRRRA